MFRVFIKLTPFELRIYCRKAFPLPSLLKDFFGFVVTR